MYQNQAHYDNAQKARIADALERIANALEELVEDQKRITDSVIDDEPNTHLV